MDAVEWKHTALDWIKKYRFVLLVFLVGIFLMLMPNAEDPIPEVPNVPTTEAAGLQDALAKILSNIEGAGRTEVLLTEAAGEQTYYQANENFSTSEHGKDQRTDTVLITNGTREETGLILRIDPPIYQGAIVLCQGAENAQVRLSIVEAVANATGLSTDKITVLKMK